MTSTVIVILQIYFLYFVFTFTGKLIPSLFFNLKRLDKIGSVHPAVIGLSCVQIVAFYDLRFLSRGISHSLPMLIVGLIVLSLAKNYRNINTLYIQLKSILKHDMWVVVASISIFCVHWRAPLEKYSIRIPGTINNDIASYAQISQHIASHGFEDSGRIIGLSAGLFARETIPGVFSSIVFSSQALGQSIANSLLPVLGVSTLILAVAFRMLFNEFSKSIALGTLVAVFAQSTPLIYYVGNQYFLGQIQAMVLLVSIFSIAISQRQFVKLDRRLHITVMVQSLIVTAMYLTYPQYVVLQGAIVFIVVYDFSSIKRFSQSIYCASLMFLFGSLLILPNLYMAIKRTFVVAEATSSGWPMPWNVPSQLLGVHWNVFSPPSGADFDLSFVIVIFFAIFCFIFRKEFELIKIFNRVIIFVALSYALVILRDGQNSYIQFKWISSLSPLLLFCFLSIVLLSIIKNLSQRSVTGLAIALVTLVSSNMIRTLWYDSQYASKTGVQADTVNLGKSGELKSLNSINVKTGPFKESMWPAFFLENSTVAILDPSYYPVADPLIAPTLVKKEFATYPWVDRTHVSENYDLIAYPHGRLSKSTTGLKANIVIDDSTLLKAGLENTLSFEVENSGSSIWLGSGLCFGCVNAAVRVLSEDRAVVVTDWRRIALGEFPNYVEPGQRVTAVASINIGVSGKYVVEFTLVSEHVKWFNEIDVLSYKEIVVDVVR